MSKSKIASSILLLLVVAFVSLAPIGPVPSLEEAAETVAVFKLTAA